MDSLDDALGVRFIPAGAGNTTCPPPDGRPPSVYPRWRGEHICCGNPRAGANGLSPLARGTLATFNAVSLMARFIPAGAGNTAQPAQHAPVYPVYPRWRGEHFRAEVNIGVLLGLSPLARGTHSLYTKQMYQHRFIPAGAGNTAVYVVTGKLGSVYPRWRGEHIFPIRQNYRKNGLSPLARGTPPTQNGHILMCRFIPAGAGNTKSYLNSMLIGTVYPRWRGEHLPLTLTFAE